MYRIMMLCALICLSMTACTVGLTERAMGTPGSGVSPIPEPTLPAPALDERPTLSPAPPTRTPAPTATPPPHPPATPVVLPEHALPEPVTLFKGEGPEIYLVEKTTWTHRHIVDWETFLHLGFEQRDIETSARFAGYPKGPPITRLLKGTGARVYWMEHGLRRHIPDMATFQQLGHRQADISEVPDELLASWPLDEPVPSVLGTPAEPVPPRSQERVVLTYSLRDRFGGGNHTNEIYTVYLDGTRPKRLSHATTGNTVHSRPVWSPDGQTIAFASTPDSDTRTTSIYVTSADTWEPSQLTGNASFDPTWSPDGARIAFWAFDGTFSIYVMDADGGNTQRLADGLRPAWTPDGRIAFCAGVANDFESLMTLTVMDAGGQNQQLVGHAITVLDQHYHPWRQDVWLADAEPCRPKGP